MATRPIKFPPEISCPPKGQATGPVGESPSTDVRVSHLPSWDFPSVNSVAFDNANTINLPAVGTEAVVVEFTVPRGFNGVIKAMGNNFIGSGFIDGSGDVVWRLLQNTQAVRNKENILNSLGTPQAPSLIGGGGFIRIIENDLIQLVVDNVAVVPAGQLIGGRLSGWLYPRDEDPAGIWF
jgi:hypothetical protein